MSTKFSEVLPNGSQKNNNGSIGSGGGNSSRGTPRQRSLQKGSRQASEDSIPSRPARRSLHPAQKKAQQLRLPSLGKNLENSTPSSAHAMHALRRLSRADFSSIRRAGRLKNLNYRQIGQRFGRQTTIHGISHAAAAPTNICRGLWISAFIFCFGALAIQVFFLIGKYRNYAKTVDLDLKFKNARFPSVTLCNLNPYKASAIAADSSTKSMLSAFQQLRAAGASEGVAAAIANAQKRRRLRRQLNGTKIREENSRRYLQINRLSGERQPGSCFAVHKGQIRLTFDDADLQNFHPTKCLCQLDWTSKTLWPCFPYNTWKEKICVECVPELGHCPMRFYRGKQDQHKLQYNTDVCLCHKEYNHCIANNENGEIPEIIPTFDVNQLNFTEAFVHSSSKKEQRQETTTTTTTEMPETRQAMGYEELKDEIAINNQARQNLMFAVEEKPLSEKVELSQSKNELILKCSFNQRDCDIENDFRLYYDPTYGNCYTFNWDRTKDVNAHRAGANYGLRVIMYANISEYLPTTEAVGFRITVHDKWNVPFPDAFGHTAPTGFMSSFGVRMKQFIRIKKPHGKCKDGGEEKENYIYKGFNYSLEGCHRSCTQNEVIRTCGCADPMYPLPNKVQSCKMTDPVARDCVKNTTQHLAQLIADDMVENCQCHQPCNEIGYEVSYSAARWPSGATKLMECVVDDDLCMQKYRINAAMIQIFFEELNFETLSETPAYTWNSFLADFGGLLGLWIGASIISVFELIALGFYAAQAYVRKRKDSLNSSVRQNVFQTFKKASSSSVSGPIYRPHTNKPRLSLPADDPDNEQMNESDEDSSSETDSKHSVARSKMSFPYWPPGQELPCTCLYNSNGNLMTMKPLCPVHGFMVRRNTEFGICEKSDDNANESDDLNNNSD